MNNSKHDNPYAFHNLLGSNSIKSTRTNPEPIRNHRTNSVPKNYGNAQNRSRTNSRNIFNGQSSTSINTSHKKPFYSNGTNYQKNIPHVINKSENENFYINVAKQKSKDPQNTDSNTFKNKPYGVNTYGSKDYTQYTYGGNRPKSSNRSPINNRFNKPNTTSYFKNAHNSGFSNKRESALYKLKRKDSGKVDLKSLDLGRKKMNPKSNYMYKMNRTNRFKTNTSNLIH